MLPSLFVGEFGLKCGKTSCDIEQDDKPAKAGGSVQARTTSHKEESIGGSQRLLVASSVGLLTEYLLEPRGQPQQGSQKVHDNSPVELIATPCVCWPLQRSASWNVVSASLSPRNPLLSADDRCRRYHESTRLRCKPRHIRSRPVTAVSSGLAQGRPPAVPKASKADLPGGAKTVCSEQPKLREVPTRASGRATPGGAVLRHRKSKKSSNAGVGEPVAPTVQGIPRMMTNSSNEEVIPSETNEKAIAERTIVPSPIREDLWPSKVEMVTHDSPARRLWMGPQFHFKPVQSAGNTHVLSAVSSSLLSQQQHQAAMVYGNGFPPDDADAQKLYDEELDFDSLPITAVRSQPVPTPAPRYGSCLSNDANMVGCCDGIPRVMIESGSGNFDKAAEMLEINCYGSPEDRNSLNGQTTEEKLVKRIADAMADLSSAPTRAKVASHSLPATHHSTPLLEGRPAPEHADFESLNVVPDQFDFSNADITDSK